MTTPRADRRRSALRPAVFLDRDGTLNVEKEYLYRYADWEWLPGVPQALRRLVKSGFKLVVVSNQSGVGRGFYTAADVVRLHRCVAAALRAEGVRIAGFYVCPHAPADGCDCRKPRPGLIQRAARERGIDLSRSFLVGDKAIDVEAALSAGVTPLLVLTGYGSKERWKVPRKVQRVKTLSSAATVILKERAKEMR